MEKFERRKQTPQYWFNKSSDLRASTGAVWYCIKHDEDKEIAEELGLGIGFSMAVATYPIFPMLCGLSLELMYKAICVVKNKTFVHEKHNLRKLCNLAEVPATKEDLLFLDLFTESVKWDGKYPVPHDKNAFEGLNKLRDKLLFEEIPNTHIKRYNERLNWDTFNALWIKAAMKFDHAKTNDCGISG
jgi:hypothetical protein